MTPDINNIYTGDCIEVMKEWPENFVDTIITDPPYGLEFMGKDWDGDVPGVHFWTEMLRVAKPGAMLLSFGGTRTWHHLATAIEQAGWVIRDCLMWLYGSGFPKSLDISKAIDKAKGAEREPSGFKKSPDGRDYSKEASAKDGLRPGTSFAVGQSLEKLTITTPSTDLAKQWSGYGTALKPAWEPIIVAMKPLDGTFAENAEKWGVAGLNVDGGRIASSAEDKNLMDAKASRNPTGVKSAFGGGIASPSNLLGRWPANLILDEEAAGMLDGVSGATASKASGYNFDSSNNDNPTHVAHNIKSGVHFADSGGASRFFYVAKSCRAERNEGCEGMDQQIVNDGRTTPIDNPFQRGDTLRTNTHPTVKPLSLMKYLCQLTRTPTGGIVLDPFAGSGTTLWAAEFHNRPWIGIEMNPEYVAIAKARIARERSQIKMKL